MDFFSRCLMAVLFSGLLAVPVQGQELNCSVTVDFRQLSGAEYEHLAKVQERVSDYLNNTTWTEDRYLQYERIECTVQISFVQAQGLDRFRAQINVGSSRPVYGTTHKTTVLQIHDANWDFQYVENQPMLFDLDRFNSFTSVLDYYALLILGYDYDSFADMGGTPFFERARRIAELADAAGGTGWSGGSDRTRSRVALVTQLLDPRMQPLRQSFFEYHFGGLDHFLSDTYAARESILTSLESLKLLYDEVSRQYAMDLFFSTKYRELVSVFEDADSRRRAYGLLLEIDPSRQTDYDRLAQ